VYRHGFRRGFQAENDGRHVPAATVNLRRIRAFAQLAVTGHEPPVMAFGKIVQFQPSGSTRGRPVNRAAVRANEIAEPMIQQLCLRVACRDMETNGASPPPNYWPIAFERLRKRATCWSDVATASQQVREGAEESLR
jgi:hypothetical protein